MSRRGLQKYFTPYPYWGIWFAVIFLPIAYATRVYFAGVPDDGGTYSLEFLKSADGDWSSVVPVTSLALGLLGALRLGIRALGMPSHRQVDQLLLRDLDRLRSKSEQETGVNEEELVGAPIEFFLWQNRREFIRGIPKTQYRMWEKRPRVTGFWNRNPKPLDLHYLYTRQSVWFYLRIFPTEDFLFLYACEFDFRQGYEINAHKKSTMPTSFESAPG
ncbi:MAG: hypothetical protein AAGD00_04405 [Planctomycetota bacterium]